MMLLNASGCLDALATPELARSLDAFVSKTVTPLPRDGNAPVRITETDAGLLNSIGLANPGVVRFAGEHLPRLAELGVPLWVSVGGFCVADYARVCERLDREPDVAAIELNVSCPSVEAAPESVFDLVTAARWATGKPLYPKLSAAVTNLAGLASAARDAGADGISLVNTLRGLALDARTLRPRLSTAVGGLSGPALRPIALAAVFECFRATGLPIVGMGGVTSGRHALELLAAGAKHVALGTILFSDSAAPDRIRAELNGELKRLPVASADDAVGLAHSEISLQASTLDQRSRVAVQVA